jgi:hypothetical protein
MIHRATFVITAALLAVGLSVWAEPPADPDDPPVLLKKKGKPNGDGPAPPPGEDKKPEPGAKDGDAKEPPAAEAEEKEEEVLQRVSKNLRTAEERLANKELGDATSQVQDDVIKDLDSLIERSERPPPQGEASNGDSSDSSSGAKGSTGAPKSSGKSGRTAKSGSSGKSGSQTTAKNGGNSPRGGDKPEAGSPSGGQKPSTGGVANQGGGGGTSETGPKDKNPDLYKDVWGHLPETLRAEMNAYANTKGFMPEYETLISKYYSTIAEQGRRKGD